MTLRMLNVKYALAFYLIQQGVFHVIWSIVKYVLNTIKINVIPVDKSANLVLQIKRLNF